MDILNIKFNISNILGFKESYCNFTEFLLRSDIKYKLENNMLSLKEEKTVTDFVRAVFLDQFLYEDDLDPMEDVDDFIDVSDYEEYDYEYEEIDEDIEELLEIFQ